MARNSSKVRTRGLQQSQPGEKRKVISIANCLVKGEKEQTHPSDPRGTLEHRGDNGILPRDQCMFCRIPYGRT